MDIVQAAKFFDTEYFDSYDFTYETWATRAFQGQMKGADKFVSIWNMPTRKRSLHTAPDQTPGAVIRVPATGEIFMVGSLQRDSVDNVGHRDVYSLHEARGTAVITRKVPTETYAGKGWAVDTLIQNTFGDAELRSVNENTESALEHFGHYTMMFPINCPVQRHDVVSLDLQDYYILEVYEFMGLRYARASTEPDDRVDFVYTEISSSSYNVATGAVVDASTVWNVTGRVVPSMVQAGANQSAPNAMVKVMVLDDFISFTPKMKDKVTYLGRTYTVEKAERNSILREWHLEARL